MILVPGHDWYGTTEATDPHDDESFDIVELLAGVPLIWICDINDGSGHNPARWKRESLVMTPTGILVQVSWEGGMIQQLKEST